MGMVALQTDTPYTVGSIYRLLASMAPEFWANEKLAATPVRIYQDEDTKVATIAIDISKWGP